MTLGYVSVEVTQRHTAVLAVRGVVGRWSLGSPSFIVATEKQAG